MAVSKRLRYEILRRDNHQCRYCHATETPLTIDHVIPTALGGTDDPANLVAACRDCNAGKSASSPDAPLVDDVAQDVLRWREALRVVAIGAGCSRDERDEVRDNFRQHWDRWKGTDTREPLPLPVDWPLTIDRFYALGLYEPDMDDAVDLTMRAFNVKNDGRFAYFCGICWNWVNERQGEARDFLRAQDARVNNGA